MQENHLAKYVRCCADLLVRRPDWIVRRKHQAELLDLWLTRHHISFDFWVPEEALPTPQGTHLVPLFVLAKTDGASFRFDLRDAKGSSVSLPTRHLNSEISAGVLLHFARERLGSRRFATDRTEIKSTLGYLARATETDALRLFISDWVAIESDVRDWRSVMADDETFMWLLRALATGSVVMVEVCGGIGSQQIIKLAYDQELMDYRYGSTANDPFANVVNRLGIRSLPMAFFVPWSAAQSFHFEFHAPPGLEVSASRLIGSDSYTHRPMRHVHLYDGEALENLYQTIRLQVRLSRDALGGPFALLTTVAILLLMIGVQQEAYLLATSAKGNAPSVLLLVPGLIATYLARPFHPLALRLSNMARVALIVAAGVTFVGALRLATLPADECSAETDIIYAFLWLIVISAIAFMAVASIHVGRMASWIRRQFE